MKPANHDGLLVDEDTSPPTAIGYLVRIGTQVAEGVICGRKITFERNGKKFEGRSKPDEGVFTFTRIA